MLTARRITLIAALLVLCACAYVQYISGYAGDRNWLLLAGRMWLGGKKLYVDIFEINPPLIVWICALATLLARHSGFLQDFQALVLIGFAVAALTIGVSVRIIARHDAFAGDMKRQAQFVLLLAFVFVVWTNPVYFGDREQLFLMLTLPYVLRWMPSVSRAPFPASLRAIIGCMAGIGYCMKPHTVIAFAGMQLIHILRERSVRILLSPENILIYAIGMLYLGLIFWLTPEYVSVVLPMALATYSSYDSRLPGLEFLMAALFILAVTFVDFRPRQQSPYRRDIPYLLAVCLVYLVYALLNNGWGYAYNPLISMLLITTGWVLWEFTGLKERHGREGLPVRQFQFGIRDCCIIFFVSTAFTLALYAQAFTSTCKDDVVCKLHARFLQVMREDHARSFGTITTSFTFWPNLMRASGAQWDTRFNHLWMLPKFFVSDEHFTQAHQWILQYVANALADDMERRKPDIMFVDVTDAFPGTSAPADLAAYFSAFPRFREAWRHYHFVQTIATCGHPEKMHCGFGVYGRVP